MRRHDQRPRRRIGRGVAPDDVSDRVDLGDQSRLAHPVADFRGNGAMRVREIGAGQSVGDLRPLREPLGELHDSLAERARLAADPIHRLRHHAHALFRQHGSCNVQHASVILPREKVGRR